VRGSAPLSLHIEYDANDALDLSEPLPIERKDTVIGVKGI
jgi:hypothetical protein